ncbi:MAG: M48 family metallopeptidase [Acidimicrobiia bacterium]|nr:M48 family metallopeptidase [Acidimicrobiia bacterium]
MQVEVVRSARRKKTVQARLVSGVLKVSIPDHFSRAEEVDWVEKMAARYRSQALTDGFDLTERALTLARRFELPAPNSITWSDRQKTRWGSCTTDTATIRISSLVANFPDWVLDYVIVHELAHLVEANHSQAFWALVDRYPRSDRARGYLVAKSDGR